MSAERPSEQEIARLREAFAADCDEPAPGSVPSSGEAPCPAPERIWDALDGALGPEELREVVDHVAVCPACAEEWRLAAAFRDELSDEAAGAEESDPPEPADLAAARGRRLQVRSWLAAAAVAVLALGVGGVWWSTSRPGAPGTTKAPVYRQGTEQTIESLLPEDRPLPRDQAVLRWTARPRRLHLRRPGLDRGPRRRRRRHRPDRGPVPDPGRRPGGPPRRHRAPLAGRGHHPGRQAARLADVRSAAGVSDLCAACQGFDRLPVKSTLLISTA